MLRAAINHPIFRSLQSRIAVFFAVLLVVVQGGALLLVDAANSRNARDNVRQELAVGERVFRRLLEQNDRQLTQAAELLSSDFAFRDAIASLDLPTIRSALLNHGSRIGADRAALISLDKKVLVEQQGDPDPRLSSAFARLIDNAERAGKAAGIVVVEGRGYQFAIVPVLAPTPIAWAAFGYIVDDRLAKEMNRLSGLDVSFLVNAGGKWIMSGSTVPPEQRAAIQQSVLDVSPAPGSSQPMMVAGDEYETLVLHLEQAGDSAILAVLQRSLEEALAPFRRLGNLLILLALGSITASIAGSVLIARSITRPLSELSNMTRRIEEGDYSHAVAVRSRDEIGELARRFNLMREGISANQEQILRLAYRDVLTDLPNRVLFNDRLHVAIEGARRTHVPLSVLVMDLDRFKNINDTLGHHIGDEVLQQVARRISVAVRKSDTTARLGGDEFALLLVSTGAEEARAVAVKISAALEESILIGEHVLDVRASIGVACFPSHGDSGDELMRHADAAMYAAKRGNAGIAMFDKGLHELEEDQLSMLGDLRRALEHGELVLAYQPKIGLIGGEPVGAEALVRWNHPERGMIPPVRFIPFAEQTGFITHITRWVLEEAARQAALWRASGHPLKIAVNVAAQDLMSADFTEFVIAVLRRHSLPPNLLSIEVTESSVMQEPSRAIAVLSQLKEAGVGRAIDDFGTGHSSLAYLKEFEIDELKIDRSFVRGIVANPKDRAIVLSTIELGHNLGLSVVAEGIEDQPTADLLRSLGCDVAQGYLYARPLDAKAFEAWLVAKLERQT